MTRHKAICNTCDKIKMINGDNICNYCYMRKIYLKRHLESPMIKCKCGHCDEMIHSISKNGLPQEFKQGHNSYFIKREGKKGVENSRWKGGRIKRNGYWCIKLHNHPYRGDGNYYPEHRYVLEQYYSTKLGIPIYILPILEVHHKNGNKGDNRVENLEILSKFKHRQHHFKKDMSGRKCLVCGSNKTYHNRKTGYAVWRSIGNGKFVCGKCGKHYFKTNSRKIKEDSK